MTRRTVLAVAALMFVGFGVGTARADHDWDRWGSARIDRHHSYGDNWYHRPYHDKYYYRGSAILRAPLPLGPRMIVPFPGHPAVVLPPTRIYGYPSYYGPGHLYSGGYPYTGTRLNFSFGW